MNTTLMIVWLVSFFCILPSVCNLLTVVLCPEYLNLVSPDQRKRTEATTKCAGWVMTDGCLQSILCTGLLVWAIAAKPSSNA